MFLFTGCIPKSVDKANRTIKKGDEEYNAYRVKVVASYEIPDTNISGEREFNYYLLISSAVNMVHAMAEAMEKAAELCNSFHGVNP